MRTSMMKIFEDSPDVVRFDPRVVMVHEESLASAAQSLLEFHQMLLEAHRLQDRKEPDRKGA